MSRDVMHVACRNCGEPVSAEDINIDKMVAKCGSCHAVFGFEIEGAVTKTRERENIAIPKSITLESQGGDLVINYRWWNIVAVIFLTVFTLIWNGVTWTFFLTMLEEGPWYIAAFLLIFVMVGAGIAYLTLGIIFNSTEIRVTSRRLTVKTGPLPMPGSLDVRSDDIDQIWVEEKISHTRSTDGNSNTSVHYPVFMRMKDGSKKTVLRYGRDSDLSLFLEQEIETHLGIEDRQMRGEF